MDAQGWYDELIAELCAAAPMRENVIRDLKELLAAIQDGDTLPTPGEND